MIDRIIISIIVLISLPIAVMLLLPNDTHYEQALEYMCNAGLVALIIGVVICCKGRGIREK